MHHEDCSVRTLSWSSADDLNGGGTNAGRSGTNSSRRPPRTTIHEVADRTLRGLHSDLRSRVLVALEHSRSRLIADPDRLSDSLAHLISRAARADAFEVLFHARLNQKAAHFTVVSRVAVSRSGGSSNPDGVNHALSDTIKSVVGFGGALSVQQTATGHLHASIQVPCAEGED